MNNYIKTMRSMIGTKPLLICGASAIVISNRQVLLQKRADNGCWSYHGGCLELGEELEEAARRELFEETGLKAGNMEFFGTFSGEDRHFIYPNGDEVYVVDTVFICRDFTGEVHADEAEVTELRWFPLNGLPDDLNRPVRDILLKFIKSETNK